MIKNKYYLQLVKLLLLFLSEQPEPTLNPHASRAHTVPSQWALTSEQIISTFFSPNNLFSSSFSIPTLYSKRMMELYIRSYGESCLSYYSEYKSSITGRKWEESFVCKFPQICSNKLNHAYIFDILATIY